MKFRGVLGQDKEWERSRKMGASCDLPLFFWPQMVYELQAHESMQNLALQGMGLRCGAGGGELSAPGTKDAEAVRLPTGAKCTGCFPGFQDNLCSELTGWFAFQPLPSQMNSLGFVLPVPTGPPLPCLSSLYLPFSLPSHPAQPPPSQNPRPIKITLSTALTPP